MKKTLVLVGAAIMAAAGIAIAEDGVYSRNVVGVVKVDAPRGQYTLLGTSLNKVGGSDTYTLAELLGNDVPAGTRAYVFTEAQTYQVFNYDVDDGWPDVQVLRGRGMFVLIPGSYSEPVYTFTLIGEVPADTHIAPLSEGFTAITFAFPVETPATSTQLAAIAAPGDAVVEWTETGWKFYNYDIDDGWPVGLVFKPGQAYFYRTNGAKEWSEASADYYTLQ